jgi:hypothetical protein
LEDTWVSDSGTFYALMVLDVNAFRDQVKGMNQLDEQVRQAIVERAEKSFDELDSGCSFSPSKSANLSMVDQERQRLGVATQCRRALMVFRGKITLPMTRLNSCI